MKSRYQNFWRRVGAAMIDGILFLPLTFLVHKFPIWLHTSPAVYEVFVVINQILILWYQIALTSKYGQTLGKMAMKIEVRTLDEKAFPKPLTVLLREAYVLLPALIFMFIDVLHALQGTFVIPASGQSPSRMDLYMIAFLGFYSAIDVGCYFFNQKRRCVHDYVAKTVVLKKNFVEEPQES